MYSLLTIRMISINWRDVTTLLTDTEPDCKELVWHSTVWHSRHLVNCHAISVLELRSLGRVRCVFYRRRIVGLYVHVTLHVCALCAWSLHIVVSEATTVAQWQTSSNLPRSYVAYTSIVYCVMCRPTLNIGHEARYWILASYRHRAVSSAQS